VNGLTGPLLCVARSASTGAIMPTDATRITPIVGFAQRRTLLPHIPFPAKPKAVLIDAFAKLNAVSIAMVHILLTVMRAPFFLARFNPTRMKELLDQKRKDRKENAPVTDSWSTVSKGKRPAHHTARMDVDASTSAQ
jgi:hypothetical protein